MFPREQKAWNWFKSFFFLVKTIEPAQTPLSKTRGQNKRIVMSHPQENQSSWSWSQLTACPEISKTAAFHRKTFRRSRDRSCGVFFVADKPVSVTPASAICGLNGMTSYCKSSVDPGTISFCFPAICDRYRPLIAGFTKAFVLHFFSCKYHTFPSIHKAADCCFRQSILSNKFRKTLNFCFSLGFSACPVRQSLPYDLLLGEHLGTIKNEFKPCANWNSTFLAPAHSSPQSWNRYETFCHPKAEQQPS